MLLKLHLWCFGQMGKCYGETTPRKSEKVRFTEEFEKRPRCSAHLLTPVPYLLYNL